MRDSRWWVKRILLVAGALILLVVGVMTAFVIWTRSGEGPRIGMSVSTDWYDRMQIHRVAYDLAIKRAGGTVVTIEPDIDRIEEILDGIDGLVLAGGGDIDPAISGCDPENALLVDRKRDDFEFQLLQRAKARGIPILGICRGFQILAISEGGRLEDLKGDVRASHGVGMKGAIAGHPVAIEPDSQLERLIGPGPHTVNSYHDQGVMDAGPTLRVTARSEDGVIEAVELPGNRMVMGIQWHPELHFQMAPFRMLVEKAKKR